MLHSPVRFPVPEAAVGVDVVCSDLEMIEHNLNLRPKSGMNDELISCGCSTGKLGVCISQYAEKNKILWFCEMSLTPSVPSVYPRVYRMVHTVAGGGWRWCGGGMIIRPRSN